MSPKGLAVDFADPEDMQAKLPRAWDCRDVAEATFAAAKKDMEFWTDVIRVLSERVGANPSVDPRPGSDREVSSEQPPDHEGRRPEVVPPPEAASPLELVVEVMNREARKLRSKDVTQILQREGHDVSTDQVSNALYYAAVTAKPPRIWRPPGRGFYAPFDYKEEEIFASYHHVPNGDGAEQNLSREAVDVPSGEGTGRNPGGST